MEIIRFGEYQKMEIIRFIVYAILMCVIQIVISSLYNRKNIAKDAVQNEMSYVVRIPKALEYVYLGFFVLGLIMFCLFLYLRIKETPTVTNGHLWMTLGMMAIGISVMAWANRWKIIVNGNKIEIQRIFRRKKVLGFSDIERVEIGKKNQMSLFSCGKKVITIDFLAVNYEYLEKNLKDLGRL